MNLKMLCVTSEPRGFVFSTKMLLWKLNPVSNSFLSGLLCVANIANQLGVILLLHLFLTPNPSFVSCFSFCCMNHRTLDCIIEPFCRLSLLVVLYSPLLFV